MKYPLLGTRTRVIANEKAEYSQIVDYRLRSTKFYLEGTKIPAFMGELTIRVNAPLPILQLADVLLRSAVYTGVGVKTSLGMGKIELY